MQGFYTVNQLADEFHKLRANMVDWQLIYQMEELLNRVPTNAEMKSHCTRVLCLEGRDLEEFYWKERFLFGVCTNVPHCYCYFDEPRIKREKP